MSVSCRAVGMDRSLAAFKSETVRGEVIGVYSHCFNIITCEGRIVSIFGHTDYLMPLSIRTDLNSDGYRLAMCAKEGDKVVISEGRLQIPTSGFCCELSGAVLQELHRCCAPGTDKALLIAQSKRMARLLIQYGKPKGEGENLEPWLRFLFEKEALPKKCRILRPLGELYSAIARKNNSDIRAALMKTVGAGIGLTPSADDIIFGMAHAVYMFRPDEVGENFLFTLRDFVRQYGRERTTSVSAQQLELSTQGIQSDPVYALLRCLALNAPEEILRQELRQTLDYGSSSGTELCMGILAGCCLANMDCDA